MLRPKHKSKIIEQHRSHAKDTGSAQVQIALLSETIERLSSHLKKNPKDNHSRRGLLKMVAKRKRLMSYLAKKDKKTYEKISKKLGLKK